MYNNQRPCQKRCSTFKKKSASTSTYLSTRIHTFCISSARSCTASCPGSSLILALTPSAGGGRAFIGVFLDAVTHSLHVYMEDFSSQTGVHQEGGPPVSAWCPRIKVSFTEMSKWLKKKTFKRTELGRTNKLWKSHSHAHKTRAHSCALTHRARRP